jgi:STE24 endopeptidase
MEVFLYYSLLVILISSFVFERWIDYLNTKNWSSELPSELSGIYDLEKYQKSRDYEKSSYRFNLVSESFAFIVVLAIFATGGFGWLDSIIRSWITNPVLVSLVYFASLGLIAEILSLPFKWYDTFIIETKFGFNRTDVKVFVLDQIKGLIIGALIGGIILCVIVWIYLIAGRLFWVYSLVVIIVFSVFMSMFYSTIFVPLFNKQSPLDDGDLKDRIKTFSDEAGFLLDNVYIIDGSKRTTKANAYFSGLGKKKRIVLYDTLISEMETEEIVAVLAHEIGHYKKHHLYSGLFLSMLSTALMLYVFSLVSDNPVFARVLGSDVTGFHLSVISFGILYAPLSSVIGIGLNYRSRMNEYQADRYAGEKLKGDYLASALKKLSVNNLSNLTPHPAYVFFHYSHPTLLQRLKKLSEIKFSDNPAC